MLIKFCVFSLSKNKCLYLYFGKDNITVQDITVKRLDVWISKCVEDLRHSLIL